MTFIGISKVYTHVQIPESTPADLRFSSSSGAPNLTLLVTITLSQAELTFFPESGERGGGAEQNKEVYASELTLLFSSSQNRQ